MSRFSSTGGQSVNSSTMVGRKDVHIVDGVVQCGHNIPAILQISKKHPTFGKSFYGCKFWKNPKQNCSFFCWEEDVEAYLAQRPEKEQSVETRMEELVGTIEGMRCVLTELKSLMEENGRLKHVIEKQKLKKSAFKRELEELRHSKKWGVALVWFVLGFLFHGILDRIR